MHISPTKDPLSIQSVCVRSGLRFLLFFCHPNILFHCRSFVPERIYYTSELEREMKCACVREGVCAHSLLRACFLLTSSQSLSRMMSKREKSLYDRAYPLEEEGTALSLALLGLACLPRELLGSGPRTQSERGWWAGSNNHASQERERG